jgi:predicted transcriptional regulator
MTTEAITVDAETAARLKSRAAEEGMSVSDLVASLMALATSPIAISSQDVAELDHRWAAVKAGEPTVPHDDVARWLESWGTPAFKPWRG